jgi:hypothetical protein
MSDKKYVVPEEKLDAVMVQITPIIEKRGFRINPQTRPDVRDTLEAFIRVQSEMPIVPTHAEVERILEMVQFQGLRGTSLDRLQDFVAMWQRRMYLEPEVPEEIKDIVSKYYGSGSLTGENLRKDFIEVYRRGQKEGTKRGAER